jgi:enamine deaminase RidA (YjgF/YER057c/UK114 family)
MRSKEVESRLRQLGLELPSPVPPSANYVPYLLSDGWLYIAGQVSTDASGGITGIVGEDVDEATAKAAARICGLNILAQMKAACEGDLGRIEQIVKLNGFVQAAANFWNIPQVINGASDLMVDVFGKRGRHSRTALGVYRLPKSFAVEVDAVARVTT